jgi:hemerythrin-like metal-binding protein
MSKEKFAPAAIGNVKFDKEHQQIFNQINYLVEATDLSPMELRSECQRLMSIMVKHCIEEEQFMLSIKYDFYEIHREQHVELTQYMKRICSNISELSGDVILFQLEKVARAFQEHIDIFDSKFYAIAPHNGF